VIHDEMNVKAENPFRSLYLDGDLAEYPARPRRRWPIWLGVLLALVAALAAASWGTGYTFAPASSVGAPLPVTVPDDAAVVAKTSAKLKSQRKQLQAALAKQSPHGVYIVVDQTQNRLYVKKDEELLHTAVCSAGSGMILTEGSGGGRRWVFDTPRGLFRVQNRVEAPVWKKPDWAFVEEGKPIPKNAADRFEYGTLGEYALYLGKGYMIHGTLYERLLGRSVTHGCIRLGRDDLRVVWKAAAIGTPVYIY
jgi:L,D-transpeptidase ErfK/SrfK